ncbi:MAG: MFS transporter [Chromatiales bacterium]|jgi:MFS transporter, FSR family, fosmidomycin resistance protein|nr:MFS transporter [Chromatiales bacterium]
MPSEYGDEATHSFRAVALFSNIGHTFTHLVTILFATAVLHLPSVFNVEYGELLGLSSLGLVLYGVGALPAGWLGDRWSQVGMMAVFFVGVGSGSIIVGIANDTTVLFIGLTLLGLFAAIYHPVGIAWLVASARKQGMTLGINGVFGALGSGLAPVLVGVMIDAGSWRAAFVVPGVLAIVSGAVLVLAWKSGRVADVTADRVPTEPPGRDAVRRVFFVLTLTMACNGLVYSGLITTMPKLFELGLGPDLVDSYTDIGLFVGAVIGSASIASLLGGWLADRYSPRLIYIVFWFALVPPLFLITWRFGITLVTLAFIAMLFIVAFAAAENMLVARYTPFEWRALAYGAKFVLALGIGGLTVWLSGALFDASGNFHFLYQLFGAAALLGAFGALLLPKRQTSLT